MQNWPEEVQEIVRLALREDTGDGDITTLAVYSGDEQGSAVLLCRETGVLAGLELAGYIVQSVSKEVIFETGMKDGQKLETGEIIAKISGPLGPILSAERTMLNFLQRMCGIATLTHAFTESLSGTKTKILDTRKTAPGLRYLDKWAVRAGGGINHRMGLYDRFLIKENHIRLSGGIVRAIERCLAYRQQTGRHEAIEIEVRNLQELDEVLEVGQVDYIMLDNMTISEMKKAVERVDGRFLTEASGNVQLSNLVNIAQTGVDFISSGALTHSVKALDISLLLEHA